MKLLPKDFFDEYEEIGSFYPMTQKLMPIDKFGLVLVITLLLGFLLS